MADAKGNKSTAPAEDEYYDDATEEFPAKEDLKDRLVAVWVTGKKGTRKSNVDQKVYPYVETVVLVLDDGPEYTGKRPDGTPNLVGPAPARLDAFQWSTAGMVARLLPRIGKKDAEGNVVYKPMVGRINSRKNRIKGMSDSWSIAAPTEDDKAAMRPFHEAMAGITAEMKDAAEGEADAQAFDNE